MTALASHVERVLATRAAPAVPEQMPRSIRVIEVPDCRQRTHFTCGKEATKAVASHFLGKDFATDQEMMTALGTTLAHSTSPQAIIDYLQSLGLDIRAKQRMTIKELAWSIKEGRPVICPVQDWSDRREPGASFNYGHWLTVISVLPGAGYVICQDSSIENAEHKPGGDVPKSGEEEGQNLAAPGRIMVRNEDWLQAWHDVDQHGKKFIRFGISVGEKPDESEPPAGFADRHAFYAATISDVQRTVYAASGPGVQADDTAPGANAMQWGHVHQARLNNVQPEFSSITGPEEVEDGVRVSWATNPLSQERRPISYQFDSTMFSETRAREWMNASGAPSDSYTFLPDSQNIVPVQQSPRDAAEKAPDSFPDLDSFYQATIDTTAPAPKEGAKVDAARAGISSLGDVVRTEGPHSYSSTQVNLAEPLRSKVLAAAAAKIPDADLAKDGRETEPHITVRYGLETDDAKDVAATLQDADAFRFTLGPVTIFEVDDKDNQRGGDHYDVVKIDVTDCDGLISLNKLLASLPHIETHPIYKPHVTLAYVKPGLGKKYVGAVDFSRELSGKASEVIFSNRAGEKTAIQLKEATS